MNLDDIIREHVSPAKPDYQRGRLKLVRRGDVYHVRGTVDGQLIRRSTGHTDVRLARVVLDDLYTNAQADWRPAIIEGDASWVDVANWVYRRHKIRAKEYGVPYQVIAADIYSLMRETNFCCAVSGIALTRKIGPSATPDPWSASLDRIEARHGYIRDNVRVVCLAANLAMNRWGYDTLLRLSRAVNRNAVNVTSEEILTHQTSTK